MVIPASHRARRAQQGVFASWGKVVVLLMLSPEFADADSDQDGAGMVVFSSERDGQPLDVYLADRAGSNVRRVTNHERTGSLVGPRWASRGRADIRVFFPPSQANNSEGPRYTLGGFQVQMISEMHRRNQPATDTTPSLSHTQPALEAFHQDEGEGFQIYVREWETDKRTMVSDASNSFHAVWSPDSESIAFLSDRHGPVEVFAMDRNGDDVVRLAPGLTGHRPVWAWPFGHGAISGQGVSRLAFLGSVQGGVPDVYVVNRDGVGLVNVSRDSSGVDAFCWSWDGTEIAFSSERDGNREIYVVTADGRHLRNVTNHHARDDRFSWASPVEVKALLAGAAIPEADLLDAGFRPGNISP